MKKIALLLAISATAVAAAQDLSTEVVVDRTVVPAERGATRLGGLSPQLVLPAVTTQSLTPVDYTGLSAITRTYSRLSPARGAFAADKTPYRGYAGIGYFPTLNLGVSAGYRFIDNDRMNLGAAVQFDGERYKPFSFEGVEKPFVLQSYSARAAVGFGYRVTDTSTISAGLSYDFLRQGSYMWGLVNTGDFGIDLSWRSKAGIVDYTVDARLNFESNGDTDFHPLLDPANAVAVPGLGQQQYIVEAEGSAPVMDNSRAGIALDADFVHTSGLAEGIEATLGTVGVTPFYQLTISNLTARVGVKVDFAAGGNGSKVSVAPEVNVQWDAAELASMWVTATGGEVMNPFSRMRQLCQYQIFAVPFGRSRIPLRLEAGLNFGPFSGFTFSLFGGYAKAKEWYVPAYRDIQPFTEREISGWHAGVKLGYSHRLFDISATAQAAPSEYAHSWIDFYDGARYVVDAEATVHPVDRLDINLGYEWRDHRFATDDPNERYSLGNKSDLRLGVSYGITPALTVYARAENLLGHRYEILPFISSQKQTGLIGLSVKF